LSDNISIDLSFDFTGAFLFVYMMSAIAFFVTIILLRSINDFLISAKNKFDIMPLSGQTFWYDFLLSISVGAADAFFVGTDNQYFSDGWLGAFDVSDSTSTFVAMCLAGSSGLCGYLIVQTIQNLIFRDEYVWLDTVREREKSGRDEESTALLSNRTKPDRDQ